MQLFVGDLVIEELEVDDRVAQLVHLSVFLGTAHFFAS